MKLYSQGLIHPGLWTANQTHSPKVPHSVHFGYFLEPVLARIRLEGCFTPEGRQRLVQKAGAPKTKYHGVQWKELPMLSGFSQPVSGFTSNYFTLVASEPWGEVLNPSSDSTYNTGMI